MTTQWSLPQAGVDPAPDLDFAVERVEALEHAAMPTLRFVLRIRREGGGPIRSVALAVQLQIAATRRRYGPGPHDRLFELFGEPARWGTTVRTLPWLRTSLTVPAFDDETLAELDVPCTYDFDVTAAKYMAALDDGVVPLELLFSGTTFYTGYDGRLQAAMIDWRKEAVCDLPVAVWREAIDSHFPDSSWLRLRRSAFDALYAYRARNSLTSWEAAIEQLLREAGR